MADGNPKEPGKGPRDVEDLKARLGLKVARRVPSVAPAPPPAPEPKPKAEDAAVVSPPPAPPPKPKVPPRPERAAPIIIEEAPPPPKTPWEKYGKPTIYALIPAIAGMILGYVFSRGSARGANLALAKSDAGKIMVLLKEAFDRVEDVAGIVDPIYGKARKEQKELPQLQAMLRRHVDWEGLDALGKVEGPKDFEQIFETDYKRFTKDTVRRLTSFFVDFTRLLQTVRLHIERTRAAQLLLNNEARAGVGPRPYAVISQALPDVPAGEIVLIRGQRFVKKGKDEVPVFDIARRNDPGRPIAVPGASVVPINSGGLFKDSGSLLEEYNRRMHDLVDILRRLLDLKPGLGIAIEKIAQMKV
jgi:hypothetical protein